jgi:hypothetical protein
MLREPSNQQIDEVRALNLDFEMAKEFLLFVNWTDETLPEILDFVKAMPIIYLAKIINTCHQIFECDEEISAKDFIQSGKIEIEGPLRIIATKAYAKMDHKFHNDLLTKLLEELGVYIKAKAPEQQFLDAHPEEAETKQPERDRAWAPLTMMVHPKGFESIQNKLVWKPREDEEVESTESKTPEEKRVLSLSDELSRSQFVALMHLTPGDKGFLQAAQDGIDSKTYLLAAEYQMDPVALKVRSQAAAAKQSETTETQTVKGRWRSRRG